MSTASSFAFQSVQGATGSILDLVNWLELQPLTHRIGSHVQWIMRSRTGLSVISLCESGFSFWPHFLGRRRYGLRSSPDVLRPDMTDLESEKKFD